MCVCVCVMCVCRHTGLVGGRQFDLIDAVRFFFCVFFWFLFFSSSLGSAFWLYSWSPFFLHIKYISFVYYHQLPPPILLIYTHMYICIYIVYIPRGISFFLYLFIGSFSSSSSSLPFYVTLWFAFSPLPMKCRLRTGGSTRFHIYIYRPNFEM